MRDKINSYRAAIFFSSYTNKKNLTLPKKMSPPERVVFAVAWPAVSMLC